MKEMKKYFRSIVCSIVLLFMVNSVSSDEILKIDGEAVNGQKVVLKCVSDSLSSLVTFNDPQGNNAGACGAPVGMTTSCGSSMGYNVTQDVANKMTYLVIDSCTSSVQGSWSCKQDTTSSLDLQCSIIPSTVTLYGMKDDDDVKLKNKDTLEVWGSTGCVYPGCTFEFQFVDKDDKSIVYNNVTVHCVNNTDETQNLNCANSAVAYDSEKLVVTKEMLNTHKPVKVKCILHVTSATLTFPYALSNRTVTDCRMMWLLLVLIMIAPIVFIIIFLCCAYWKKEPFTAAVMGWRWIVVAVCIVLLLILAITYYYTLCFRDHVIAAGIVTALFASVIACIPMILALKTASESTGKGKGRWCTVMMSCLKCKNNPCCCCKAPKDNSTESPGKCENCYVKCYEPMCSFCCAPYCWNCQDESQFTYGWTELCAHRGSCSVDPESSDGQKDPKFREKEDPHGKTISPEKSRKQKDPKFREKEDSDGKTGKGAENEVSPKAKTPRKKNRSAKGKEKKQKKKKTEDDIEQSENYEKIIQGDIKASPHGRLQPLETNLATSPRKLPVPPIATDG